MKSLLFLGAVVSLLTAGCRFDAEKSTSASPDGQQPAAAIVAGQTPSEAEKAKLLAAKEALFAKLSGRLMEAMSQGGPAAAIEVCQVEAKSMAIQIGRQSNVQIGRTGVRLRNANNQPPHWATQLVADKIDQPVFVRLSNDRAAALLPIKLQVQCLMCHGPSEQLAPDVKAQLARLYPQDQATGFSEGELRGWFWVESLDSK